MKWWSNSEVFVNGPFVPEKRLLAAVLQRAITDYLTGDDEMRESAKTWIIDNEYTSDSPLTFRFICEALDLDCDNLRKAILVQNETVPAAEAPVSSEFNFDSGVAAI